MVYLNRIYTRQGDSGKTSLGNGDRVPKTNQRIVAYGSTDELNAFLGVCLLTELPQPWFERLQAIQNDLFDLSADLCVPESDEPLEYTPLRVSPAQVASLEIWIDEGQRSTRAADQFHPPRRLSRLHPSTRRQNRLSPR